MSFRAHDNRASKRSGTAGDATPTGRNNHEPNGGTPMDPATNPTPVPDGTPIDELIARRERKRLDAAEQLDNGVRLASQQMWDEVLRIGEAQATPVAEENLAVKFDGLGADPKPEPIAAEVDDAAIGRAADKVAAFRDEFAADLHHLRKHAPRRLHIEAKAMVDECDDFLGAVRAYFMEQAS